MAYKRKIFTWDGSFAMGSYRVSYPYYYYRSCEYAMILTDADMIRCKTLEELGGTLYQSRDEVCIDPEVRRLLELVYFVANG